MITLKIQGIVEAPIGYQIKNPQYSSFKIATCENFSTKVKFFQKKTKTQNYASLKKISTNKKCFFPPFTTVYQISEP